MDLQGRQLAFDLEERQERLQKVLERRRQSSTCTPTSMTSGSDIPVTETQATSEAVPDTKEPKKPKKSKKPKDLKAAKKN